MGLIQDAVQLAQAGYSPTSAALDILHKLGNETNYLVWSEILAGTSDVAGILWEQSDEITQGFDKFRRSLVSGLAKEIGFESLAASGEESEDRIQLRVKILSAAATAKDE